MYKLLITDVDGTLVDKGDRISNENLEALALAKAAGVHIAISTGRSALSSLRHIDALGLNGYNCFYDGAFIYNHRTLDVLHAAKMRTTANGEAGPFRRCHGHVPGAL